MIIILGFIVYTSHSVLATTLTATSTLNEPVTYDPEFDPNAYVDRVPDKNFRVYETYSEVIEMNFITRLIYILEQLVIPVVGILIVIIGTLFIHRTRRKSKDKSV